MSIQKIFSPLWFIKPFVVLVVTSLNNGKCNFSVVIQQLTLPFSVSTNVFRLLG